MNELLKAKEDVISDIAQIEAQDDTAVIAELVAKYRAEIEAKYAADKAAQLAELNAGLKYIQRAIDRAESQAQAELNQPEVADTVEEV